MRWDAPTPSSSLETKTDLLLAWYVRACARDILDSVATAVRFGTGDETTGAHEKVAQFVEGWVEGLERVRKKVRCGGMEEVRIETFIIYFIYISLKYLFNYYFIYFTILFTVFFFFLFFSME